MTRALVLGLWVLAAPLAAQGLKITQPAPDCALARKTFDNPFSDSKGWVMRRYEWHTFYVSLSGVTALALRHAPFAPSWLRGRIGSGAVTAVGLGIVPHVRSVLIQRRYPIDPLDLAFDLWDKSGTLVGGLGASGATWQSRTLAATTWAGGYLALMCYASP